MKNKLFPVFTLLLVCFFALGGCRQASESVNSGLSPSPQPALQATPEAEKSDTVIVPSKPPKAVIFLTHKLQADLDGDGRLESVKAGVSRRGEEPPEEFLKIVKSQPPHGAQKLLFAENYACGLNVTEMQIWDHPQAGRLLLIKQVAGSGGFLTPLLLSYNRTAQKIIKISLIKSPSLWHGRCSIKGADLICSESDASYYNRFSCNAACRPPYINYIYRYNPGKKAFLLAQTTYELPYRKAPKAYFNALDLIDRADKSGNKGYSYQAAIKILKNLQATSQKPAYQTAIDYCHTQIRNLKQKKA